MAGEGRANLLPGPLVDPVSGQPAFKNSAVRIEPVIPEWRAFLVSVESCAPSGLLWWSRSRVKGGWLHELAGMGAVDCDALLPSGQRLEVADVVRGMRRIVVTGANGAVAAALFVTRSGQLPPRDWISGQLDGGDGAGAIELSPAGRPPRRPIAVRWSASVTAWAPTRSLPQLKRVPPASERWARSHACGHHQAVVALPFPA